MKFEEKVSNYFGQTSPKEVLHNAGLKRAITSSYNRDILRRAMTTRINLDKADHDTELIWENEKVNIEDQEVFERKKISIFRFYYILFEPLDWVFLIIGLIGCLASGVSTPLIYYLNALVYTDVGVTSEKRGSESEEELMKEQVKETMNSNIKQQFIYGSIALVDNFVAYFFIGLISTRSLYNFKKKYFRLIFAQEQAWFDSTNVFSFASKIQAQLEFLEVGLGEVIVDCIVKICILLGSLIFAFLGSWKLTLVILCLVPFMTIFCICLSRSNYKGSMLTRDVYQAAGTIAEEILYNIKIIISFANFDYELKRFYEKTEISALLDKKQKFRLGLYLAFLYLGQVLSVFIGLIYGRTLVKNDYNSLFGRDTSGGDITLTFNCMVTLIAALVDMSNDLGDNSISLSATSDFFNLIERKPKMNLDNSIEKPPLSNINGNIEFINVDFYYPTDNEKKLVLNGINLKFESGKKIALIGESGSGKTTIANLIERLYDIYHCI